MVVKKTVLNNRKQAIAQLVQAHAIEDQAELITLLEQQYGIATNQAAISRDLRSLGISKRPRGSLSVYDLPQIDVVSEIMHYAVKSIVHNEVMVLVNTLSGTADVVGDFLDRQKDLAILGTLAGENVVFVMPRSIKDVEKLAQQIAQRIKIKGEISEKK